MTNEPNADTERVNPRTRRVRKVILDAATDVLVNRGAHEVTAARVAEHADVARTTVYRHWPDQRALLLATIDALTAPDHRTPVAGYIDVDIGTVLGQLRTRLTSHDVASIAGALASHAAQDRAFSDGQRRLMQQLARPTMVVLLAAQEQGLLNGDLDPEFEAMQLAGPLLHQHLALHDEITDDFINEIAQRWLVIHGVS